MIKITSILRLLLFLCLLSSCSGSKDDTEIMNVELSTSKKAIIADGLDKAEFTVLLNGVDVTDDAKIYDADTDTALKFTHFSTEEAGVYKFYSVVNSVKSNIVTITSESGVTPIEYKRHIAIFKFTGTWCTFCPLAGTQIDYLLSKPKYTNGHVIAFHGGYEYEPMIIPETEILYKHFKLEGYPSASIDMRDKSNSTNMTTATRDAMDSSLTEYPAYFSVSVESKADENNKNVKVDVEVNSSVTDIYKVVLYVVENGLIYEQKLDGITDPNYKHNHVARRLVSKSVFGDSMGTVASGSKAKMSYDVELDSKWNVENLYMYALIISEKTGYIHNMAYCKAINGFMDSEE